jgi:hypothetical protein
MIGTGSIDNKALKRMASAGKHLDVSICVRGICGASTASSLACQGVTLGCGKIFKPN